MDVELRQLPATFTGIPNYSSSLVSSGTRARTSTATGMAAGNWGWKYRIVDSTGVSTGWLPAGNPDSIVQNTAQVPTVTTLAATAVSTTSVTLNGRVDSNGGSAITDRRFEWAKNSGTWGTGTPGVDWGLIYNASISGPDSGFSAVLSGLHANTVYKYRVYAWNSVGPSSASLVNVETFTTGVSCAYSLLPSSASPSASSGSGSFTVSTASGCTWSASPSASWIHTTSSGTGSGSVSYSYDANTSSSSRSGTITVGGQTFNITQAGQSGSADYPGATWIPAADGTFGTASRSYSDVRWIVIHTTEGTTASAIARFQNGSDPDRPSAHYIVSRDGSITQMVHNNNASYAAGNLSYNDTCINIEHERYSTYDCTAVQYQASATLVKWLLAQYNVSVSFPSVPTGIAPANPSAGSGIIGHVQVPDPTNPTLGGGLSHHTDPVNWDWAGYEVLIQGNTLANMSLNYNGTVIPNGDTTPSTAKGTDFGVVTNGFSSSPRTFTIHNSGNGPLNLTGTPRVQFGGLNPSDFYMTALPATLVGANGGSTTFDLVFEPTVNTGLRTATVTIANDDPTKHPYTFTVQGTAQIQQRVDPLLEYSGVKSLNGDQSPTVSKGTEFGSVNVGSQSSTHSFQFYNHGTINMTLTGSLVQLSGANSGDFAILSMPATPVAPGSYSTIGIRFEPTGPGLRTANMLISFDATYGLGAISPTQLLCRELERSRPRASFR